MERISATLHTFMKTPKIDMLLADHQKTAGNNIPHIPSEMNDNASSVQ
jgi:hypothetical protein